MFSYLARLILAFAVIVSCLPVQASVRQTCDPPPQEIARRQHCENYGKADPSGEHEPLIFVIGDWIQRNNGAISLVFAAAVAAFTYMLASRTSKLWRATNEVAEAAKKSAGTAEKAFTNLERPYVYIYGVTRFEKPRNRPLNEPPIVTYSIANWGRSPAELDTIKAGISTFSDGPLDPLVIDERDELHSKLLRSPILSAGKERHDIGIIAPDGIDFHMPGDVIEPIVPDGEQAFVWIKIRYSGPFTDGHETAVCWKWDAYTKRLVRLKEYEYTYMK